MMTYDVSDQLRQYICRIAAVLCLPLPDLDSYSECRAFVLAHEEAYLDAISSGGPNFA